MRHPLHRSRRSLRGFTLVEVVISAGLLGILAATATFFWVNGFSLVRSVNADSQGLADGRAVLERLAREIREVKYDTASGAYCVKTPFAASSLVFNKTVGTYATGCGGYTSPGSGTADFAVTVQLPTGSTTLSLGYAGTLASPAATGALTSFASGFSMRYLDAAFTVTTSAAALRFVELTLTLQPPGAPATQTRSLVALRNR